jgi:hypothetical protein
MKIDIGDGDWEFFHCEGFDSSKGWRNILLVTPRPDQTGKRRYHLGWNGERLSVCHDSKLLYDRHSRLFWVLLKLCREIWPTDARA